MPAGCNITEGFQLGCRDNTGGLKAIYIYSGSFEDLTITEANNAITSISGSAPAGNWFRYDVPRQTSDFTETINGSTENQTVFYEQTVNVTFAKMQSSLRNQVKILAQNPELRIIVETNNSGENNDKFFLVGRTRGASLDTGTGTTGTAFGDLNGYTLPFVGQEPNPADAISGSILANVLDGPGISY